MNNMGHPVWYTKNHTRPEERNHNRGNANV